MQPRGPKTSMKVKNTDFRHQLSHLRVYNLGEMMYFALSCLVAIIYLTAMCLHFFFTDNIDIIILVFQSC